jgi:hypothetical protein
MLAKAQFGLLQKYKDYVKLDAALRKYISIFDTDVFGDGEDSFNKHHIRLSFRHKTVGLETLPVRYASSEQELPKAGKTPQHRQL